MSLQPQAQRPAHLFVDISAHGLGHLAQTAPVLQALRRRRPGLRLTLRSALPNALLRSRLGEAFGEFTHLEAASDFGYVMHDATEIDLAASAAAYRAAHADWPARVAAEAEGLAALAPDLVLSNVAYLPLAGAAQTGIRSLSMCSLNWGDLFAHFFGAAPWAAPIQAQIDAAYAGADAFLRLTPAMPMPRQPRIVDLPPVAVPGKARPAELRAALGCAADVRLVLVAFGGFSKALPLENWPEQPGLCVLIPGLGENPRSDVADPATLDFGFSDLLASVDAVLTKPGYGTFVEAACAGTPVLYLRRPDWPEQDALIDWLHANARALEIDAAVLARGTLAAALPRLWTQAAPPRPEADGAARIADLLSAALLA